jgi:hypothetical protein
MTERSVLAQLAKALYEGERGTPFPEHYGPLLHVYVGRVARLLLTTTHPTRQREEAERQREKAERHQNGAHG